MIVIFGSGIIGLFTALQLLNSGKQIIIFDVKDNKGSATDASVGMLAPLIEAKPYENDLLNLMIDSKKIWDDFLKKNFKDEIGLKKNSSLLVSINEDEQESILFKKKFLEKLGFFPKFLSHNETLSIEPNLNSNIRSSIFLENNNQVEPPLLKKFLLDQIKEKKGELIFLKKIEKINFSSNNLYVNERKYFAEKIVISCGAWSNDLLKESFNVEFPMRPIKGASMLIKSKEKLFTNNIWFKNIYLAPRINNNIAIGATEDEKGFESSVMLDEIFFLSSKLWEYMPELEKLEFKKIKAGIRSNVIDGKPIIGSLKCNKDILCSFGHYRNGILLAPISAEIISNYVLKKKISNKHLFFSPKRFNL